MIPMLTMDVKLVPVLINTKRVTVRPVVAPTMAKAYFIAFSNIIPTPEILFKRNTYNIIFIGTFSTFMCHAVFN